jgi:hypothetical protein
MSNPVYMTQARAYLRSRIQVFMDAECIITRRTAPIFDIDTGSASGGTAETIYEGDCRIWEVTGAGSVVVNEQDVEFQSTQLSLPWDIFPVPIKNDYVKIVSCPQDSNMNGRTFEIQDMVKSGTLRPTRRFSIKMVQEKS